MSDTGAFTQLLHSFLALARLVRAERIAQAHRESRPTSSLSRSELTPAPFLSSRIRHYRSGEYFRVWTEPETIQFRHGTPGKTWHEALEIALHDRRRLLAIDEDVRPTIRRVIPAESVLLYVSPAVYFLAEETVANLTSLEHPRSRRSSVGASAKSLPWPSLPHTNEQEATDHLLKELSAARDDLSTVGHTLLEVLTSQVAMIGLEQVALDRKVDQYSDELKDWANWARSITATAGPAEEGAVS